MTLRVDPQRRAELDAELGPIAPDPAEIEGATEPHSYGRLLARIESARRDAVAAGVNAVPDLTKERADRALEGLMRASSAKGRGRGRPAADAPSPEMGSVSMWGSTGASDSAAERPMPEAKFLDATGMSIEQLFGDSSSDAAPTDSGDPMAAEGAGAAATQLLPEADDLPPLDESDDDFLDRL